MNNVSKLEAMMIVLRNFSKDNEVLSGGIPNEKEERYWKKYGLTIEDTGNIMTAVYGLAHGAKIKLEWD